MSLSLPLELLGADNLFEAAEELHRYAEALKKSTEAASLPALSPPSAALLSGLPAKLRTEPQAVEELRGELEGLAASAPNVALTLAAPATAELKQELVGWLRREVRPNVLVSFHVNVDIAGGVVIRAGSHIYDCSFRTALLAQPQRFTEALERV